jgi:hypothetical protein
MGAALGLGLRKTYRLLASGELTLDLALGRRLQPLGPLVWSIQAPQEIVFDVIAAPYLGRTPRALADKLQVWERGAAADPSSGTPTTPSKPPQAGAIKNPSAPSPPAATSSAPPQESRTDSFRSFEVESHLVRRTAA